MARNYNNLQIYHLAYDFALSIYDKTKNFPEEEKHNVTSQIRRASVSISLNIAEGSAKASFGEFAYFLNVAWASGKEVEVLLKLSKDFGYLNSNDHILLSKKLDELNAKTFLYLRNIESRVPNKKYQFFRKFEKRDKVKKSN